MNVTDLPQLSGLNNKKVALLGCGDIGCRLAGQLKNAGADVIAYRRDISDIQDKIDAVCVDFQYPEQLNVLASHPFDYVVITLVPDRSQSGSVAAYESGYINNLKHILAALDITALRKVFWVSSTSVYAQGEGVWLKEDSLATPASDTGKILLAAEDLLAPLGDKVSVIRFAGIYREEKHRLLKKLMQGELARDIDINYYSNRIHVDDCAGILGYLMSLDANGKQLDALYLGVDSEPVDYQTLVEWLSEQCDQPLNEHLKAKAPVNSKRISNQRLLDAGYQFLYPSFRQGFKKLVDVYK